jgi:hypothetical protein
LRVLKVIILIKPSSSRYTSELSGVSAKELGFVFIKLADVPMPSVIDPVHLPTNALKDHVLIFKYLTICALQSITKPNVLSEDRINWG